MTISQLTVQIYTMYYTLKLLYECKDNNLLKEKINHMSNMFNIGQNVSNIGNYWTNMAIYQLRVQIYPMYDISKLLYECKDNNLLEENNLSHVQYVQHWTKCVQYW